MEVIKIGGITYKVNYKEIEESSGGLFGEVFYDKAEININNHNIVEQKQAQTLIHEMTHAIFHEAGLDELNNEEEVVNDIALILHQVLKDNDFSWMRY